MRAPTRTSPAAADAKLVHCLTVLVLLIPALTYLLLNCVRLLGRILHDIGGNQPGGKPTASLRA